MVVMVIEGGRVRVWCPWSIVREDGTEGNFYGVLEVEGNEGETIGKRE